MGNSAAELHLIFEKWKSVADGRTTAFVSRGLHDGNKDRSDAAFDEHLRAMRLLAECQTFVNELESSGRDVTTFRRTLRLWAAVVMHYPYNWQAAGEAAATLNQHGLDTLSALSLVMETRGPVLLDDAQRQLRALLDDVTTLLKEDQTLSADLRSHVYLVVQMLNRYLDDVEMYGQADIKEALRDLWVSLLAAAGQSGEAHKSKWEAFVQKIGIPAVGTIMGSIPTLALEAASLATGA